jgi:hypothetical protein
LSWSGAARGLAADARVRGRGGRKEEKGGERLEAPVAERGDAAEASGRELGVAGERKGKADGWDPPVSCPGRKEGEASKQIAMVGWAGGVGPVRVRGRKGGREGQLGSGSVGRWAGGPLGVLEVRVWI